MIDASELGYINWESVDREQCEWLIQRAQQRLDDLRATDGDDDE